MDEHLKELLQLVFELGFNRGLGSVAPNEVLEVEFNEVLTRLRNESSIDNVQLVRIR